MHKPSQLDQKHKPSHQQKTQAAVDYARAIFAVTWKDLLVEYKSRELLIGMTVFSVLAIVIFNFAIDLEPALRLVITPGVLWVTIVFAGTIGLNRSISVDNDHGGMDGLLLTPPDHTVILIGKIVGNMIFVGIVEIIVVLIYSFLYNIAVMNLTFLLVLFLGSFGYVTVGTLISFITIQTRLRDMFLPILLFPVIMPVILASVKASNGVLQGFAVSAIIPWINILIGYDLIFLAVSIMLFDFVIQE